MSSSLSHFVDENGHIYLDKPQKLACGAGGGGATPPPTPPSIQWQELFEPILGTLLADLLVSTFPFTYYLSPAWPCRHRALMR